MNENQPFAQGARGCLITLFIILAALFAMTVSIGYQYPAHPSCGGMLGAGFPVLFICDDWGGGSPTGSWGKITPVDIPNGGIRPTGFLIDLLFYTLLVWFVWLAAASIFQNRLNRPELWWAILLSLGFLSGFVCAFLTFRSSSLYQGERYFYASATPVLPSPTPF